MIYDIEFRWLELQGKGPWEKRLQTRKLIKKPNSEEQDLQWTAWKDVPIASRDRRITDR